MHCRRCQTAAISAADILSSAVGYRRVWRGLLTSRCLVGLKSCTEYLVRICERSSEDFREGRDEQIVSVREIRCGRRGAGAGCRAVKR